MPAGSGPDGGGQKKRALLEGGAGGEGAAVIVVDASAVIEALFQTARGRRFTARLRGGRTAIAAPHLIDSEVVQVPRRYQLAGEIADERAPRRSRTGGGCAWLATRTSRSSRGSGGSGPT
jgi:hypothetical protein